MLVDTQVEESHDLIDLSNDHNDENDETMSETIIRPRKKIRRM